MYDCHSSSGALNGEDQECTECNGSGAIRFVGQEPNTPDLVCPWCHGSTHVFVENERKHGINMKEATELPIKHITDFDAQDSVKKLYRSPQFWVWFVLAMVVIGGVLVSYFAATRTEIAPWALLGFLVALFIGCTRVIDLLDEARKARAERYASYLESVSPDLLKVIASSPEYDQLTKDAVIKYLSAAHPGWSLT